MKVLIDTNIIMDYLSNRQPFFDMADKVINLCSDDNKVQSYLAAHTITNIFYLLRKHFSIDRRRELILDLFEAFHIVSIDEEKLFNALRNKEFKDFEDCLQVECTKSIKADYIITRDAKDFANSEITFLTPEEFCSKFEENHFKNIDE